MRIHTVAPGTNETSRRLPRLNRRQSAVARTKNVKADDHNKYTKDRPGWASDMRERFQDVALLRPLTQSTTSVIGAAKDFAISTILSPATLRLQQSSACHTAFIVCSSPPPPAARNAARTAIRFGTIEAGGRVSKEGGRVT